VSEHVVLHVAVDSRIGRQPNALKHTTFLQLCRIKTAKGITSSTDPFTLMETKPNLVEADGSGTTRTTANISPDQTVTTSHDSQPLTSPQKKPRRPYRRRSAKMTAGFSDDSTSLHYVDSTQSQLSPVEIKQETLSPVDCNVGELFDQLGVELVEDFAICEEQRPIAKHPECLNENTDDALSVVECNGSGYPESEPPCDFQACASNSVEPGIDVQNHDCVSTAVLASNTSSHAVQSDYDQVISSMQRAFYDLLPILRRVCNAVLLTFQQI